MNKKVHLLFTSKWFKYNAIKTLNLKSEAAFWNIIDTVVELDLKSFEKKNNNTQTS